MTKETLFESMRYIGDDLLAESEKPARPRRAWIGVVAAVACLVLIAGVWQSRSQPRQRAGGVPELKVNQTAPPDALKGGDQTPPPDVMPVGVPGSVNGPAGIAAPTVLAWNELESMPETETAFFALFGQPLTEEQLKECGPEIRLEWMESLRGVALFFGMGELYRVELTASNPAWDGQVQLRIRDRDSLQAPAFDADWLEKTGKRAALNGQEYRAYRLEYDYLPGEPHVWMCVVFEKENLEYTLLADAPAARETEAAVDLMDLLLAYAGTHSVPDLAAIPWDEQASRTPPEAPAG